MLLKSDRYDEPCTSAVPLIALNMPFHVLGITAGKDKVDSNSKTKNPSNRYSSFRDANTERIDMAAYF